MHLASSDCIWPRQIASGSSVRLHLAARASQPLWGTRLQSCFVGSTTVRVPHNGPCSPQRLTRCYVGSMRVSMAVGALLLPSAVGRDVCSSGSMRLSILRCGSRWWQVWEDTESAAGNLRRDQHAPPHDGAAPCGFCLTRHRGTIHHAWRGEVASGAPPRRGQLTVALGVRFDSTKGARIRKGVPWTGTPYTGNAPFDSRYVFIFEHMSEARAKTGPRTNERLGATTLATTL